MTTFVHRKAPQYVLVFGIYLIRKFIIKRQSTNTLLVDFVIILVSGTASEECKGLKKTGDHHHEMGNLREENGGGNDEGIVSIHETS